MAIELLNFVKGLFPLYTPVHNGFLAVSCNFSMRFKHSVIKHSVLKHSVLKHSVLKQSVLKHGFKTPCPKLFGQP
jgi:hypothetical protein